MTVGTHYTLISPFGNDNYVTMNTEVEWPTKKKPLNA